MLLKWSFLNDGVVWSNIKVDDVLERNICVENSIGYTNLKYERVSKRKRKT